MAGHFTTYSSVSPMITKDGSTVREFMHPDTNSIKTQSLAEAIVQPEKSTFNHYHAVSEEIYHITEGQGTVCREGEKIEVRKGDTVFFSPGTHHYVVNTGTSELKILCFMSPPYTHDQTFLVENNK